MPRTKGALGKTETKHQVRERIAAIEASENNGVPPSVPVVTPDDSEVPVPEVAPKVAARSARHKRESLEIAPPETDTYRCGACHAVLTAPFAQCPKCGTGLLWT